MDQRGGVDGPTSIDAGGFGDGETLLPLHHHHHHHHWTSSHIDSECYTDMYWQRKFTSILRHNRGLVKSYPSAELFLRKETSDKSSSTWWHTYSRHLHINFACHVRLTWWR